MKITVITVTFNARKALEKTMRSVDAQDYPDLEYVVVDGRSSDGTVEMLANYGGRLNRWLSEPDSGIYHAMNKGVAMASGDYCIFMNAGDTFVASDTVTRVVARINGEDVVYGDIMKNGRRVIASEPRNCHKMFYCHQSAFVATRCLKEFPFDTAHPMSADFKQAKQMILAGRTFRHIDLIVADFDTNGVSNTSRSKGLLDNIKVICEVDGPLDRFRLLTRILPTYLLCKARGK